MKKSEALKTLGLTEGASDDEVKKAHRKLVIENHPDKFGQDAEARAQAEEKTKLINEARDVLLNRSWDPEYGTQGTPYGAPFNYNPYSTAGRPGYAYTSGSPYGGTRGNAQDPFAGFPFETFVWTTWDANSQSQGSSHTARGTYTGADPFGGMGFDFSAFIPRQPSAEELLKQAKAELKLDIELIVVKLIVLGLSFVVSAPATGLYLYTLISIGQGFWKRLSYLSLIFLVPFAMLAIIFAPSSNSAIGLFALVLFFCAVCFDVQNVYRCIKRIRTLKQKIGDA